MSAEIPDFANAAEIDEWLARLSREDSERVRTEAGVSYSDQVDAAQRQTVAESERVLKNPARWVSNTSSPAWVRLGAYDVLLAWFQGRADTCLLAPSPLNPEPVFAAAYKPNLLVCQRCTHLLVVRGEADDHELDSSTAGLITHLRQFRMS